jgi:ABC-2 type transport system ATP-binding protein
MWDYIRNLAKQMGITIFLTTHYMEEADQLADRIAIIDLGNIIATGTPSDLKQSVGGDVVTLSPCDKGEAECQEFMKRTEAILSGQPFVTRIQATDGDLAVYVNKGESAAPNIMRLLANAGIEVDTLSVSRPSLDDVFLKYTGRSIRSQEGKATTFG